MRERDDMKDTIIVTTPEALEELVEKAVERAMQKAAAIHDAPAEILNRKQVAKLIGVHTHTIPSLVSEQGLPTLRRVGTLWRFRRSDVLAWLARRDNA
jgi:excisionase family DNA binding protein